MFNHYFKHKDCISTCITVVKFRRIEGKPYCLIKVRWYSLHPDGPMDMGIETWLTTADSYGKNTRQRRKYPLDTWNNDWKVYKV